MCDWWWYYLCHHYGRTCGYPLLQTVIQCAGVLFSGWQMPKWPVPRRLSPGSPLIIYKTYGTVILKRHPIITAISYMHHNIKTKNYIQVNSGDSFILFLSHLGQRLPFCYDCNFFCAPRDLLCTNCGFYKAMCHYWYRIPGRVIV